MPQSDQLMDTLKRTLRAQQKTYRDVAEVLDLSEASVKRLFAERNLSLQRLDRICQMLQMEISDLVQAMSEQAQAISRLSVAQEHRLASHLPLLLVTVCVLNRWSMADILDAFKISEPDCIHYLATLDKLKIIDLLPGNRIKLKVAVNFAWLPNGPIQRFFQQRIKEDYFRSGFDHEGEQLLVINGMLSAASNAVFQGKLQRLKQDLTRLTQRMRHCR